MTFSPVPELLDELREGRMIILVDDEDRENEGDLAMAAEMVTPEAINFMVIKGRGLVCLPMSGEYVDRLQLPMQTPANSSRFGTAFTVSIDAKRGVTTGVSASDRATTIKAAIDPEVGPEEMVRPGHVFPLRAEEGGVLVRTGQTEGTVDLCQLAGLKPAGVICEIMNDDGTMARVPDLLKFAKKHQLKMGSVADIIEYRRRNERLVERVTSTRLPTDFGDWDVHVYSSTVDDYEHLVLTMGLPAPQASTPPIADPILVRVHAESFPMDLVNTHLTEKGSVLQRAMRQIAREGRGVLLYMRQESHRLGMARHVEEMTPLDEEQKVDSELPADIRHYGIGAQILRDLGVRKLKLLTNNPRKYHAIKGYNLEIVERVGIEAIPELFVEFGFGDLFLLLIILGKIE